VWIAGKPTEGRQLCGIVAAAGEGITGARFTTGLDFGAADALPKIGQDAIPLGLATIRLDAAAPAAAGGTP
jgi:hypothetical protein